MGRELVFLLVVSCAILCFGIVFAVDAAIPAAVGTEKEESQENTLDEANQTNKDEIQNGETNGETLSAVPQSTTNMSCTGNNTECVSKPPSKDEGLPEYPHNPMRTLYENREMLKRAFYVLIAVTAVVVLYFVVKNVLLKRKQSKTVKYGIISTPGSDLEMQPLDQGDDDDDMTLYEARTTKLK